MRERLQCDIILRGGIASGLVYPGAISKLAETYDFRSIGGSSAGAIAASWTAAAALGAKRNPDIFQTTIKTHPQELARTDNGKTVYERLFQPQPGTRRLFNLFIASLRGKSPVPRAGRVFLGLFAEYPLFALAGAMLVLVPFMTLSLAKGSSGWTHVILVASSLVLVGLLAATFSLLAASGAAVRDIIVEIPKNRFGLCSGSSDGIPDSRDVLPLTDWLHNFLQRLADRPFDQPVTFGDLWNTDGNEAVEREIELEFMTTNITRGVSHRLPFLEGNWGQLFFKEDDFAQLFPRTVVDWMKSHAQGPRLSGAKIPEGYYRLPKPSDLPILFGARMSAGLPFLLSAIPLYAVHVTQADEVVLKCCWFSDGGIASDLPLHFFDAPIPRRPTFAINFVSSSVDAVEVYEINGVLRRGSGLDAGKGCNGHPWDKVWMPQRNSEGISWAVRFNEFHGVGGFARAVLDTALNWSDTELMAMPGYRDRIVHVKLAANEGGLNLNMPPQVISGLSTRGEFAGKLLAARFAPRPGKDPKTGEHIELTWDNHRWIRYRSVMAALEVLTRRFQTAWHDTGKPWRSYSELLSRNKGVNPQSYPLERPEQYKFAVCTTGQFLALAESWISQAQAFDVRSRSAEGGTPQPKPVLRMVPPGSNDPRA